MNGMENNASRKNITAVITGATSGIGFATASLLAGRGVTVIGTGRDPVRCDRATEEIRKNYPDAKVFYLTADLSSLKQVWKLAEDIQALLKSLGKSHLDALVNNAGTFSDWYVSTPEGFELQFAVNHLAPFLLTRALLPNLMAAPSARVITVSSGSHYGARIHWKDVLLRRHYNCLRAYKQSKLANVLFTAEFNRRFGSKLPVRAFAVDPGLVNTEIGLKGTSGLVRLIWNIRRKKGTDASVPASCITFLCCEPQIHASPDEVYWKNCKPKTPSRYSQKPDVAARLWDISEKMCGIKYDTIFL